MMFSYEDYMTYCGCWGYCGCCGNRKKTEVIVDWNRSTPTKKSARDPPIDLSYPQATELHDWSRSRNSQAERTFKSNTRNHHDQRRNKRPSTSKMERLTHSQSTNRTKHRTKANYCRPTLARRSHIHKRTTTDSRSEMGFSYDEGEQSQSCH